MHFNFHVQNVLRHGLEDDQMRHDEPSWFSWYMIIQDERRKREEGKQSFPQLQVNPASHSLKGIMWYEEENLGQT